MSSHAHRKNGLHAGGLIHLKKEIHTNRSTLTHTYDTNITEDIVSIVISKTE